MVPEKKVSLLKPFFSGSKSIFQKYRSSFAIPNHQLLNHVKLIFGPAKKERVGGQQTNLFSLFWFLLKVRPSSAVSAAMSQEVLQAAAPMATSWHIHFIILLEWVKQFCSPSLLKRLYYITSFQAPSL